MKTPIEMLKDAQANHYAVGHFNMSTLEILKANTRSAKDLNSPVIIATSEGERAYFGVKESVALLNIIREELGITAFLNADHTKSFEKFKEAVDAGYEMAHIDASSLDFEENIKLTKECCDYAKSKSRDIEVEGELGAILGGSELHKEKAVILESNLTDPDKVAEFIERTGIDSLAISVGNIHGMYGGKDLENPHLDIARIEKIRQITNAFLVLHGGSGTPEEDIKSAIEKGIVKININTELRLAFADSLKNFFAKNPDETTPYKIFPSVIDAVSEVVNKKIMLFGSNNRG